MKRAASLPGGRVRERTLRAALVMLLLVAAAVTAWISNRDPATPTSPGQTKAGSPPPTAAPPPPSREPALPLPATAITAAPFPVDAVWSEVRVIDEIDGTPIAGVDVWWKDHTTEERLLDLPPEQRAAFTDDDERLARTFGWHTRTDADGLARVHVGDEYSTVFARTGDRHGQGEVEREHAEHRHLIAIGADIECVVRVIDAQGNHAVGVPVEFEADEGSAWFFPFETDATGVVRVPRVQDALHRHPDGRLVNSRLRAAVAIPGIENCVAEIDALPAPKEPMTLVLPATGALHVHVVDRGRPATRFVAKLLHGEHSATALGGWSREADDDGIVRFPHVPIGRTFTVQADLDELELPLTITGPVHGGQVVHAFCTVPDRAITLTGRLLLPDGLPVESLQPGHRLDVRLEAATSKHPHTRLAAGTRWITPDADGRFVIRLRETLPPSENGTLDRFAVELWRGPADILHGSVAERELQPGGNDLGDIRLDQLPLLVSGRAHFDQPPEYRSVAFRAEHWIEGDAANPGRWQVDDGLERSADDDGRFVVRGTPWRGRLRLNFEPFGAAEFTPGQRDLRVGLREGHAVRIHCLLPGWAERGSLEYSCTKDGDGPAAYAPFASGRAPTAWLMGLSAGSYTVRIRNVEGELLAHEEAIALPTKEGLRERQITFNLRERLTPLYVAARDDADRAIDTWIYVFVDQSLEQGLRVAHRLPGRPILVPGRPVDLTLIAEGFRPLHLRGVTGAVEATLARRPRLRLSAEGIPKHPELAVRLYIADGSSTPTSMVQVVDAGSWQLQELLDRSTTWDLERDDSCEITADTAAGKVSASLSTDSGWKKLQGLSPSVIPPGTAPVTLRFDTAEIERMLAEQRRR